MGKDVPEGKGADSSTTSPVPTGGTGPAQAGDTSLPSDADHESPTTGEPGLEADGLDEGDEEGEQGKTYDRRIKGHDDPRHCSIVGLTGTGKTHLAIQMFKRTERAVFCNVGHEDTLGQDDFYFKGEHMVSSAEDALRYLFNETPTRCVWNCDAWEVRSFIAQVLAAQRVRPDKYPIKMFIDEADLVAPKYSIDLREAVEKGREPNELGLLCINGRRWNIQAFWISQRPQDIDTTIYRRSEYKIFFRLDAGDVDYFYQKGIKLEPKEDQEWEARQS